MIPHSLIFIAATVTAAGVGIAGLRSAWGRTEIVSAALLTLLFIVLWREVANGAALNADFGPLVSVGDVGCFAAGALGPMFVAVVRRPPNARWAPAIVGGLLGFAVNVVIL